MKRQQIEGKGEGKRRQGEVEVDEEAEKRKWRIGKESQIVKDNLLKTCTV